MTNTVKDRFKTFNLFGIGQYTSHMCDISLPPSYTPDGMDQQIITGTVSSESHRQWWEGGVATTFTKRWTSLKRM